LLSLEVILTDAGLTFLAR